jgi:hypothetical protein
MSQEDDFSNEDPKQPPPMDLTKYRSLPGKLMFAGAIVTVVGLIVSWQHDGGTNFLFSWLVAFMFVLSLGLGGWPW